MKPCISPAICLRSLKTLRSFVGSRSCERGVSIVGSRRSTISGRRLKFSMYSRTYFWDFIESSKYYYLPWTTTDSYRLFTLPPVFRVEFPWNTTTSNNITFSSNTTTTSCCL